MSLYRLSVRLISNNLSKDIKINIGLQANNQLVFGANIQTQRNFSALQKKYVSRIWSKIKKTRRDYE